MSTLDRQAAWASYARSLGVPSTDRESLEYTEMDFKAGYDAGVTARACARCASAADLLPFPGGLQSQATVEEKA
jgi:hypothetical protein